MVGLNRVFDDFVQYLNTILPMNRHRRNVKKMKILVGLRQILVGLRPYQAYRKRHPWCMHTTAEVSRLKFFGTD